MPDLRLLVTVHAETPALLERATYAVDDALRVMRMGGVVQYTVQPVESPDEDDAERA